MLFNSYIFLFGFLPCVLAGWWLLPGKSLRLAFLTGSSWFFYAWWDWRYLPVLILATSVDFVAGLWIAGTRRRAPRRLLLAASLTTNVGILAYFKYAGFFVDTLNGIGSGLGLPPDIATLHIVLPIGISFYTFNSMSYTIDIFRRRIGPTRNVLEYSTFVVAVSAPDRGADRPVHRPRRPAQAPDATAHLALRGARPLLPVLRSRQEARDRRSAASLRHAGSTPTMPSSAS